MKKASSPLVLLLSIILSLGMILAGCSGSKEVVNTDKPKEQEGQANKPAANELKPYKLTLYYQGKPQKDEQMVEEEINKYLKDKINATVDLIAVEIGAWDERMTLLMAAGEEADIIFTAAWAGYSVNVAKGAFLPLDDLLKKHGQDIISSLDPRFLEGSKINGKNYGVPTNKELAAQRGLMIRKDLLEKYKLDVSTIKTWDDIEPFLKVIKDNEPGITPFYASNDNGLIPNLDWDFLGDATVPGVLHKIGTKTTVLNEVETPEFKHAAELTRKWYQLGYINKDGATSTVKARELVKSGKLFMYTSALKPGAAAETSPNAGYELVQVGITKPTITTGDATGAMLAISRTSKDPDRAMMLINLLHKDPYLVNLMVFGIEGKHYVKVSDKIIDFPAGIDGNNVGYLPANNWMIGNQFHNYLRKTEDPQKWENFKKFNESGVPSVALGFAFNSEPVKTEIAAVANVNKEFKSSINAGIVDPNEFIPKYLDKLKSAGVDKIIAEKQKQLNEFLAKK
jgi:putative aldouronate transport system substrate-binding protein